MPGVCMRKSTPSEPDRDTRNGPSQDPSWWHCRRCILEEKYLSVFSITSSTLLRWLRTVRRDGCCSNATIFVRSARCGRVCILINWRAILPSCTEMIYFRLLKKITLYNAPWDVRTTLVRVWTMARDVEGPQTIVGASHIPSHAVWSSFFFTSLRKISLTWAIFLLRKDGAWAAKMFLFFPASN